MASARAKSSSINREGRIQGQVDNPLNEAGIRLGKITGQALKEIRFDYILSSPLQRAIQTAQLVTGPSFEEKGYTLPIHTDPRLMEIDVGIWDGTYH